MASRAPTIQDFGLERDRLEFFGRLMPPNYFGFLQHFLGPCQPTDADWQFYNIHKVMRHEGSRQVRAVPDDVDMTPWGDDDMEESESDYCDSDYGGGAERVFIHSYAVSLARGAYVVLNAQLADELPGRPGPRLTEMRLWEMIQANWAAAAAAAAAADADAGSAAPRESTESRPGDGHSSEQQPCPRLKYLGVKLIENQTSRGAIACEFDASLAGAPGAGLHLGGAGAGAGTRERVVVTEDRSVAWTANPFTRCACRVAGGAGGVRAHLLREDASRGAVMDMFVELGLER